MEPGEVTPFGGCPAFLAGSMCCSSFVSLGDVADPLRIIAESLRKKDETVHVDVSVSVACVRR